MLYVGLLCIGLLAALGLLVACSPLPPLKDRSQSTTLPTQQTRMTPLGKAVAAQVSMHPGKTGIYMLDDPYDAFAARAVLAQMAEQSLDVQYYIWRKDLTGTLLFQALHAAADRGVRVRLLLDDNNTSGLDTVLAALDAHPNIEVRLFNPFVMRNQRWLTYLTDFSRVNRRMHNKSFTADNQATIIGGRNIGDEYFGATQGVQFADLDVLALGPVVDEISKDFDRYWASNSSYPAQLLLPAADTYTVETLGTDAAVIEQNPAAAAYTNALRRSSLVRQLMDASLPLVWASAQLVSDDPAKGLGKAGPKGLLTDEFARIIGKPRSSVSLISPYFVPTAAGVNAFSAMSKNGVEIQVLTNSLEATDVAAVHAGYAKRRKALLQAGIKLYETRRMAPVSKKGWMASRFGSSASSLHAKTFSVDSSRVFIGSFNFDPRSVKLNTESGLIIESATIADQIDAAFKISIPANTYEVRLSDSGQLYWLEQLDGKTIRYDTEPGTSFLQRAVIEVIAILPIEWLL
ncbi:MAG: phospholipase D family protein [Burkholderiaceae bacterium]|nr:phospholipase D family protein [Burkholderiaceae bacterium]